MTKSTWSWYLVATLLLSTYACQNNSGIDSEEAEAVTEESTPEFLPLTEVDLSDLSAFSTEGDNWSIAGGVTSSFDKEWQLGVSSGVGVLANQVEDQGARDRPADGAHLFTNFQHGDLELELEVLVPKGSNSGLYFQGRYELQIRDTADDDDVSSDDMGGIYAHWKDGDTDNGAEGGVAPKINAARAPGLWQKYHVLFRAPTFDEAGLKITNARFEYVYLNGFLIHENVEVSAPTIEAMSNDEVSEGPLMIQGNHGPVAFRNIEYKIFEKDIPTLTNLKYELYLGKYDYIPDFEELEIAKSGTLSSFDKLPDLAGQNDGFNLVIEGDLNISKAGSYLLETIIDDAGDLFIDDKLVVHNQGEPGRGTERAIVELTSGVHRLKQTYNQEVWGSVLTINIEGPGIEKMEIPTRTEPVETPWWAVREDLELKVQSEPELIRAFVNHFDKKKTHILSVGTPQGIHYSYDTRNNQLINLWKGQFADVSRMWNRRGEPQRLDPLGAVLGIRNINLNTECDPEGYALNAAGLPVYQYTCGGQKISDAITPKEDGKGMIRIISVDKNELDVPVATGSSIVQLENGWYSIDGLYYLSPSKDNQSWNLKNGVLSATATLYSDVEFEMYW